MKKLFTLISLTALFLTVACKKAEVFPVSSNDTLKVDTVKVDSTQESPYKSNKDLIKGEDTSL